MPAPLISRDEALARITEVFQRHGYEGTSLSALSSATGLVKASLYHHFPDGKKAMAIAAIERSGELLNELVITPLKSDQPPAVRLGEMLQGVDRFYHGGEKLCLFGLLSIGDARDLFAPHIGPHITGWVEALAGTLIDLGLPPEEAGAKTEQMLVAVEGALLIARATGDVGVFQRTLDRMRADISSVKK